jgi:hypothetical protein
MHVLLTVIKSLIELFTSRYLGWVIWVILKVSHTPNVADLLLGFNLLCVVIHLMNLRLIVDVSMRVRVQFKVLDLVVRTLSMIQIYFSVGLWLSRQPPGLLHKFGQLIFGRLNASILCYNLLMRYSCEWVGDFIDLRADVAFPDLVRKDESLTLAHWIYFPMPLLEFSKL